MRKSIDKGLQKKAIAKKKLKLVNMFELIFFFSLLPIPRFDGFKSHKSLYTWGKCMREVFTISSNIIENTHTIRRHIHTYCFASFIIYIYKNVYVYTYVGAYRLLFAFHELSIYICMDLLFFFVFLVKLGLILSVQMPFRVNSLLSLLYIYIHKRCFFLFLSNKGQIVHLKWLL